MKTVAIQGIRGSYSEEAAIKMMPRSVRLIECADFASVFEAVRSNADTCGIVPLRNTIIGEIEPVAELLQKGAVEILEEYDLDIEHVLAAIGGAEIGKLTEVHSHPAALKQCRDFLDANSHIRPVDAGGTASSIRGVVEEANRLHAAICSRSAADIYGAEVLSERISDIEENKTTFGLIARKN